MRTYNFTVLIEKDKGDGYINKGDSDKGDGSFCLKYKKPGQKALSGLFIF